jgi:hypothetical protein
MASGRGAPAWPSAWVWANLAADNGFDKAAVLRDQSFRKISLDDQTASASVLANWRQGPCTWHEVHR